MSRNKPLQRKKNQQRDNKGPHYDGKIKKAKRNAQVPTKILRAASKSDMLENEGETLNKKGYLKTDCGSHDKRNMENSHQSTSNQLETSTAKKRKKAKKKSHDGMSNWKMLCTTLKKDPTLRKSSFFKGQEGKDIEVEKGAAMSQKSPKDVWFDNVDSVYLEATDASDAVSRPGRDSSAVTTVSSPVTNRLVKEGSFQGLTKCVAMDCEMVGIGPQGEESMLARVSIVNQFGACLYDKFVLPREQVVDYRTHVSGITEKNLRSGEEFLTVQKEVNAIIKGRLLIGHALQNDLQVLFLTHPKKMTRDTSKYKPFREMFNGRPPALKNLTDKVLGVKVQEGQHSSVEDAQAAMRLYTMFRQRWEKENKLAYKGKSASVS